MNRLFKLVLVALLGVGFGRFLVIALVGVVATGALAEETKGQTDPATFVERTWKVPPDFLLVWQKRQFEEGGTEKWAPNLSFEYEYSPFWMFVANGIDSSIDGATGGFSASAGELRMRYPKATIAKMDQVVASMRPFKMFSVDRELFHPVPLEPSAFEKAVRENERKLREIIIPVLDFEDVSLLEAATILEKRTKELDVGELDESKKGIKFTLVPRTEGENVKDAEAGLGSLNHRTGRIKELELRNIPVGTALQYLCGRTLLSFQVNEKGVSILHAAWSDELPPVLFERQLRVAPEVIAVLRDEESWAASWKEPDPFGSDDEIDRRKEVAKVREKLKACPVLELLELYDVDFPRGSTATYDADKKLLTVKSSDPILEVLERGLERVAIVLSRGRELEK